MNRSPLPFFLIRSRKINRPFFSVGVPPGGEGMGWKARSIDHFFDRILVYVYNNTRTFYKSGKSCAKRAVYYKYDKNFEHCRASFTKKRYVHREIIASA